MNRVYKTIKNPLTKTTVVASELAKGQGKKANTFSSLIETQQHGTLSLIKVGALLTAATLGCNAFAQTAIYDGTGAGVQLEPASGIEGGLPAWMNLAPADSGLVYRSSGAVVTNNADLVVDYATGSAPKFVIGGYSNTGATVELNTVKLNSGTVDGPVYAGMSHWTDIVGPVSSSGDAESVSYAIQNANVNANQNTLWVDSHNSVNGDLYGGYGMVWAQSGDATTTAAHAESKAYAWGTIIHASANTVTVQNNATVTGNIYAGFGSIFVQSGNAVTGDSVPYSYTQPRSQMEVGIIHITANDNTLHISEDVSMAGDLYGGAATALLRTGTATAGDTISSDSGGNPESMIFAAPAFEVNQNQVRVMERAQITGSIYGGYANHTAITSTTKMGSLALNDDIMNALANSSINSNYGDRHLYANDNRVSVMENAVVGGSIYGGNASLYLEAGNASADDRPLATVPFPIAQASIYIDDMTMSANQNTVTIGNASQIGGDVYGGHASFVVKGGTAIAGTINGGVDLAQAPIYASNAQVSANDNIVTFDGILQGGSLYGGDVVFDITQGTALAGGLTGDNSVNLSNTTAQAINNTVTIGENAQINSATGSLYGGHLVMNPGLEPQSYDAFTGNTLNWSAKAPATLQTVANFENYNFTINPTYANTSTALITAQDIVLGTDASNISTGTITPSKVTVVGIHSGNALNAGDKFILLNATNSMTGNGSGGIDSGVTQAQQGVSLLYDVQTTVDIGGQQVTATILGRDEGTAASVNPQLKALSEGYLAGAMFVSRGADLIADEAIRAINIQNNQNGWMPFAVLSGQHNRYNSGSHIKSNDFLLTGGLSYQQDHLTAGIFVEGGWGSYDSYNSFYNAANVKGDGHDRYYGAGFLGHYDFQNGLYADASLRFGRNHNKFDTQDIANITTGQFANYTLKSNYMSAHIGTGYIVPIDDKNELDLSAKYLWTRLDGKNANVAGDPIHFDPINSHRVRVNAALNHNYSDTLTLNAGLGYEYEFDGKARATTYGIYNIDAPSVRGSTGIISIGANIRPTSNQRLSLDINANGYGGKREGVGASIRLNYAF